MRRTRIRRVSPKQAARNAEYAKVRGQWMPLHPVCEVCPVILAAGFKVRCTRVSTHPHHMNGRTGPNLCDTSTWKASCDGTGHPEWIHNNMGKARAIGLLT